MFTILVNIEWKGSGRLKLMLLSIHAINRVLRLENKFIFKNKGTLNGAYTDYKSF